MSRLTPAQIAAVAYAAGFRNGAGYQGRGLTWAVAVALAESDGDPTDVSPPNRDQWRSVDRGLWQINSHWHAEVSAAAALNPSSCAAAAFKISKAGKDWHEWSTFKNGTAGAQLGRAALAVRSVGTGTTAAASAEAASWTDLLNGLNPVGGLGSALGRDLGGQLFGTDGTGAAGLGDLLSTPGNAVDALAAVAKSMAALASGYVHLYEWVANPHNAARVAFVVLGGSAALAGLVMLGHSEVGGPVGAAARAPGAAARGARKAASTAGQAAAAVATDGASAAASGAAKAAKVAG